MAKANFNRPFRPFFAVVAVLLALFGCSSPEERKAEALRDAVETRESGNVSGALHALEELAARHPDDPAILRQIGVTYRAKNDPTMAAFFLEQAYRNSDGDLDLLESAHRALIAAGQSETAAEFGEKLASQAPDRLSADAWFRIGRRRAAQDRHESALNAYLNGVNQQAGKPSADVAVAVGELFNDLGNRAQAETWFRKALEREETETLPALMGLLEATLRQKDWPAADAVAQRLEEKYPGALETTPWADAREELREWREAQDAMDEQLASAETEGGDETASSGAADPGGASGQPAREAAGDPGEGADSGAETASAGTEPSGEDGGQAAASSGAAAGEAAQGAGSGETTASASGTGQAGDAPAGGKRAATEDFEKARRMARKEAEEPPAESADAPAESDGEQADASPSAVPDNPAIAIRPAAPAPGLTVSHGDSGAGGAADVRLEAGEPSDGATRARSVSDYVATAEEARSERAYDRAIRAYWQALGQANERADIWNDLSRVYLAANQPANAEATALEAMRLAPDNDRYALDYLRIVQRAKSRRELLEELQDARERFPGSPEIALSLARAQERVADNSEAARRLYREFLDMAPGHPLAPEARKALERL